ncbi:hypothetical protein [Acidicapsa acidisoli]|uniref:hypothetical protein n=1 Tax=Acidicapsa acidisoli TaxID=1615681 RepID=UPI0021DF5F49|nr:hypothetical protein [Acidicapsa acidisoli]
MTTNLFAPDPLDSLAYIDGPPVLEPDYNEPVKDPRSDPGSDPDSGELPEDEPEDEMPEEDPDDEPLAEEDDAVLGEPIGERDVEMDDEIFRQRHADAEAGLAQ